MRYPIIDTLRGLSVLGMMFFHLNYMLEYIFYRDIIPLPQGFWDILGPTVAITFIILSGFSFFLSSQEKPFSLIVKKSLRRTLVLGVCASVITFVTYTYIPDQRISWGIIHFFALSSLMILPFTSLGKYTILIGIFLIPIGMILNGIRVDTNFFIPFGLIPRSYFAADWYPLLPWFGYMLIGQGIAYWMKHMDILPLLAKIRSHYLALFSFIGRHALIVYMLHIPIFYFLLLFIIKNPS